MLFFDLSCIIFTILFNSRCLRSNISLFGLCATNDANNGFVFILLFLVVNLNQNSCGKSRNLLRAMNTCRRTERTISITMNQLQRKNPKNQLTQHQLSCSASVKYNVEIKQVTCLRTKKKNLISKKVQQQNVF